VERGPAGPEIRREAVPRFLAEGLLGQGGMGSVEASRDNDIGRTVAIKRLHPQVATPQGVLRFADEIRTLGRLEHPNVVPVHDVGLDEQGRYFLVMKHVRGEPLDAIIRRLAAGDAATHARYRFEVRVEIFRGILSAIDFAHSRGILHRDLKPSNVMVGEHGEVVVLDWGLARPLGAPEELAESGEIGEKASGAGRGFEQARGEPLDVRSDIYALCVLFHELLGLRHYLAECGSVPEIFAGVLEKDPRFLTIGRNPFQPLVPMDLLWFAKKGLAKDRERRYGSVREMILRLDARAEGVVPIQCHVTFTQRVGRGFLNASARHPILLALALFALLAGAVHGLGVALGAWGA
jgi:serine/threonine-protein kinase